MTQRLSWGCRARLHTLAASIAMFRRRGQLSAAACGPLTRPRRSTSVRLPCEGHDAQQAVSLLLLTAWQMRSSRDGMPEVQYLIRPAGCRLFASGSECTLEQ